MVMEMGKLGIGLKQWAAVRAWVESMRVAVQLLFGYLHRSSA